MKRSIYALALLAIPGLLLFNSCEKEKLVEEEIKAEAPVPVKIVTGCKAIDIQFDHNGCLYILGSDRIQLLTNDKLKTLTLPAAAFSDFIYYDESNHGASQYIAADRNGTIFLARKDGMRIVHKDGKVETYIAGDTGWGVEDLEDLAISQTNEVIYSTLAEGVVKLDNRIAGHFSGILPYEFDTYSFNLSPPRLEINAIDISSGNIFWLGTNKGIVKAEAAETNIVKAKPIGAVAGTKAEGPVDQVKMTKVTQLEASDDGSIICFIDQGVLKQVKNNVVKIIMPMPDTRIALSKDARKLYFIENGDLMVIDL
jgi:ligand-binding sensor domain-containing protein